MIGKISYEKVFFEIASNNDNRTGLRTKRELTYFGLDEICRATLNQVLYFVGLRNSTPTIACALSNLLPALTFILAVPFRY